LSGLVGAFARDGRPIGSSPLVPMMAAVRHRGPDATRSWSDGPVALGHVLMATLPEDRGDHQPLGSADGQLRIVFDGRLDNREALAEEFARARVPLAGQSDAAFALAAYQRWDDEFAAHLLGDFALAIWNAPRRRLFCARDVLGLKPLYYFTSPRLFLFASEREALLAHPAVSRRVNDGMIGEHLSIVTSVDETLLADIQRLPRARSLAATSEAVTVRQYWEIDVSREIRYHSQAEYGEHLRSLLRESVRARLRSASPVGLMLSGGVDSSSILGMATELRRTGSSDTRCDAFSLVDPGGELDESRYIEKVASKHGACVRTFTPDVFPLEHYEAAARRRDDVPPWPNDRMLCTLRRSAADAGSRVLLSGIWGDEWFSGSYYHCADLFRALRWGTLATTVRTQARFPEVPLPGPLPKILVWPLLSHGTRRRIKRILGRTGVPSYIEPAFARRINLADRLFPKRELPFPTIAQRNIYAEMTGGLSMLGIEESVRAGAELGVEMRYPYADRRIMEFGMAIPEDLRWRDGVKKYILRDAMRAYLPDEVRQRLTSPDASAPFVRTLRAMARRQMFEAPLIAREGWVDAGAVRSFYQNVVGRHDAGDSSYGDQTWPLWSVASVELWMRVQAAGAADIGAEETRHGTKRRTS